MKPFHFLLTLVVLLSAHFSAFADCERPFLFFDLGNTLVDTRTYKFEKIIYMPGAFTYIAELKRRGYSLGLIANIPESWGSTRAEKLATLRKFISDRWADPNPMIWDAFDLGILIPLKNSERKPAPVLFNQAMALAQQTHCKAIYEGEEDQEMVAAHNAGMFPFKVGRADRFYLPIDEIDDFVKP